MIHADIVLALRRQLPAWCHRHIDGAFDDPEAAFRVLMGAPNADRPHVVRLLFAGRASLEVRQRVLRDCWNRDHHHMLNTMARVEIARLRIAGTIDEALPEGLTVYRGGTRSLAVERRQWSWTTELGCAAWFAGHYTGRGSGAPLVLRAEITRARVAHTDNERGEREIVIIGGCPEAVPVAIGAGEINRIGQKWRSTGEG
jgi:hypothetical protein